ncbi:GSCOCG00006955001-RA-CDS [Cotesia congregata]|uniref:Uncharacterized protein n=1 Tax=Cotesia congregata TaxID=51543 RepID=A0A8J2HIR8_COTCN|nr:GSCOCG00006955001-RA-CDS [Cotesia congregata]CAG5092645.1 Protein of unknown function [Cotesia congregata]
MILSALIVLTAQFFSVQGDFVVLLKDIDCPLFNEEYFTEPDTYIDDNNAIFFNTTIVKEFLPLTQGYLGIIGASLGEYVVNTGIDVEMTLCDMMNEPVIMGPLLRVFGFSDDNCPPKPGVYGSEGYTLPTATFPDDFPRNQYKAVFKLTNEDEELIILNIYFEIQ